MVVSCLRVRFHFDVQGNGNKPTANRMQQTPCLGCMPGVSAAGSLIRGVSCRFTHSAFARTK